MKSRSFILSIACSVAIAPAMLAQAPFAFGNIVVLRVGDGSAALSTAAAAMFLDEYTPAGALVQTIALPTSTSGSNHAITVRGIATSEAYLGVSTNGVYLLACGYDAAVGTPDIGTAGELPTTTNRVIARVDLVGTVDTSTALTDAYTGSNNGVSVTSQGNPRAVASDDGQRFWIAGTGSTSDSGVRFVPFPGATTSIGLNAGAPTNCRVAGIHDGQLYTTSASTVYLGLNQVGLGLPTTGGQPISLLPGFPTAGGTAAGSAYDFFFAGPDTVYVADDNSIGSSVGGIQKWTFNGTTWVRQYRLQLATDTGCRGLTGFVQNGVVTLWGTVNTSSTGGAQTQLVTVTDTGPGSVVTSLATSPSNTAFRGLRYIAKPSTLQRFANSCGSADIEVNGNCEIGTDVRTTILNPVGFPFVGYGSTSLNLPFCGCTVAHDFTLLVGGPTHTLSLPFDPAVTGFVIYIQGLDFLAPGACSPGLPFALTDSFAFTVQ
ncbi:MAG TPA: hypothetical protein VFZ65_03200 [Planctomycetota bacterium]|nr:hypothetical protein [Planctomycetota bacterium]